MKKKMSIILVFSILLCTLFGCANNNSETSKIESEEKSNDILSDFTMAYLGIDALNPVLSTSNIDHSILYLLESQLIRLYGNEIVNDAAESYDVSDDYTTYTFHVRNDLKWSDGTPLTAQDFEYGMYCLLAPEMGSPRASSWYAIKNSEKFSKGDTTWDKVGVKALDEGTLEFVLERPVADYDRTIALEHIYPINKSFLNKVGVEQLGASPDKLLYSGPYILTSRNNSDLDLKKNVGYWNSDSSFPTENLHFLLIDDPNTQIAMFENHEIDVIQYVPGEYNTYLNEYIQTVSGGGIEMIWMNESAPNDETARLMNNKNFRLALSYAINREDVTLASNSAYTPFNRIIDPGFTVSTGNSFIDEYPVNSVPLNGDVKVAKEYLKLALDELGYSSVSDIPELSVITFPGDNYKHECETLIDEWKKNLGIKSFSLTQYDVSLAIDTFFNADFDMFVISCESNVRPTDIMETLMTGGTYNPGTWHNENFDDLVKSAVEELDSTKRNELTHKAEQLFVDEAGMVPIYILNSVSAVQSNVSGYQNGAIDGFEFDKLVVKKSNN